MNEKRLVARTVAGHSYGGMNQGFKREEPAAAGDESNTEPASPLPTKGVPNHDRPQKRPHQKVETNHLFAAPPKPPVSLEEVKRKAVWREETVPHYYTVNYDVLIRNIRTAMNAPGSSFVEFYDPLLDALCKSDLRKGQLQLTKIWQIPGKRETYIWVKLPELRQEFILPNSFMTDCRSAFQNGGFR